MTPDAYEAYKFWGLEAHRRLIFQPLGVFCDVGKRDTQEAGASANDKDPGKVSYACTHTTLPVEAYFML